MSRAALDSHAAELRSGGEILVVEDTAASLALLATLLGGAGYRVRQAPNGELALWSATAQPPELILLDVRMPGMDGYEVCRRLKQVKTLREVPVIFLSAFTDTDDKLRGFEAGGVDFISKPYQFEEVNARVMAHLQIGRLRQRLAYQNEHLQELVEAKARELAETQRESHQRLAEIAHMNRNASATVYCAALVHELNQPLAAIMSNAEAAELFLEMDPPQMDDVKEILRDIRRDDLRASELIQRMRELLKKSEPVTEALDLNQVVRETATLLASEARMRKVTLRLQLATMPLAVVGDDIQLQQVMINLILNAMDAMAACPEGARLIEIGSSIEDAREVEVRVSDSGRGFDANVARVFESFFTTKPQGMGLGLSITAAILASHGGRVWAENNPAGGASVRFRLPLRREQVA